MNKDNLVLLGHLMNRHQHFVAKKGAQKPLLMIYMGSFGGLFNGVSQPVGFCYKQPLVSRNLCY